MALTLAPEIGVFVPSAMTLIKSAEPCPSYRRHVVPERVKETVVVVVEVTVSILELLPKAAKIVAARMTPATTIAAAMVMYERLLRTGG